MSLALTVRDLTVAYGGITAVRHVTFSVPAGAIATIIGANGAGKTTILNALSGLRDVRGGTIMLGREPIDMLPPHERVRVGLCQVPEGRRLFGRMSVAENLEMGAYARRDRPAVAAAIEKVLELFPRLRERYHQAAGTLSGGEQQMVAMGRAILGAPKLLLLDEPTMGLAPQIVDLVMEAILAINKTGVTVLFVEQNAYRALEIAEHAFVLETGEIMLEGTGTELLDNARVRSAYLGVEA
jgi:branched-chain amino acid transport system ATP-binding protein